MNAPMTSTEWTRCFLKLKAFKEKNGHCRVPFRYKADYELALFVKRQRRLYLEKALPKDKFQKLDSLGFIWDVWNGVWERKLELLKEFKKIHGHLQAPESHPELGLWVKMQRRAFVLGTLNQERRQKLETMGFIFVAGEIESWEHSFERLKEFKKKHGHCRVKDVHDNKLASWVSRQRHVHNKGELSEEQIRKLNSIGFIWDVFNDTWEQMFELLIRFHAKHGHCVTSRIDQDLHQWTITQRFRYSKKLLSRDRIKQLESLGFAWRIYGEYWEQMFAEFKKYVAVNGDGNIRKRQKDPILQKVSNWVTVQRRAKKQGTLSAERMRMLTDAGFVWDASVVGITKEAPVLKSTPKPAIKNTQENRRKRRRKRRRKSTPEHIAESLPARQPKRVPKRLPARQPKRTPKSLSKPPKEKNSLVTKLENFFLQNGHFDIPNTYPYLELYQDIQMTLPSIGKDSKLKSYLDGMGYPLDEKSKNWERMFATAKDFYHRHGHFRFPQGSAMQLWSKTQCHFAAIGELDLDREGRLEELGMVKAG